MLKTAVIGAGTMGALYARVFDESGRAELSAIVDVDLDRAEQASAKSAGARAYRNVADLLANEHIDAAAVSLPDYAHRDTVVELLTAGVHVLCEKPLATTLEDCVDIIAESNRAASLMVNYGNRHRPEARTLRELVKSGSLGDIQTITMKGNEKLAKTRQLAWRDRTDPTWFLISHLVDFVSWVTGERFVDVYGLQPSSQGDLRLTDAVDPLPAQTCHSYLASLESGAVVSLTASWILPPGGPAAGDMAIEIIGSRGYAKVDFMERPVVTYGTTAEHLSWDFAPDFSGRLRGWWITSCDYFLDCVANDQAPEPNAHEGAETSLVLLAMHESLTSGTRAAVAPYRRELDTLLARHSQHGVNSA